MKVWSGLRIIVTLLLVLLFVIVVGILPAMYKHRVDKDCRLQIESKTFFSGIGPVYIFRDMKTGREYIMSKRGGIDPAGKSEYCTCCYEPTH